MVCYAYLHDIYGSHFPTEQGQGEYPQVGWLAGVVFARMDTSGDDRPELFNSDWTSIGVKKTPGVRGLHVIVDNHGLSLPSNHLVHSLLASLSP